MSDGAASSYPIRFLKRFKGEGVGARALRSSGWTALQMGASQLIRLVSNLILTRLLFPEAFGLMALVWVVLTGLTLLSDAGIRASIIQNKREDRAFLDTAWTVQVIRGVLLWLTACMLAAPAAALYSAPQLVQVLPVVALGLIIDGLKPTAFHSASRHLKLARPVMIDIGAQIIGILVMIVLAYSMRSVWALVVGHLVGETLKLVAYRWHLPDSENRFRLERPALADLFSFGKYIFLATIAGFLVSQGDRMILGMYLTLEELGIYQIGFFLASVPTLLANSLEYQVVFPVYRMKPPNESVENQRALFRARRALTGLLVIGSILAGFIGIWAVDLLYDDRYASAGPILVLYCLSHIPVFVLGFVHAPLLALGDSRRFFFVMGTTAVLQVSFVILGFEVAGLFGAIFAPGLAFLATYPMRVIFARRYASWDPLHDAVFLTLGFAGTGLACWLHWEEITTLLT